MSTLAIIGAGLSGALCAQQLSAAGWQVKVFEKSRGVGGRMATRRTRITGPEGVELTAEFDHGAPDFSSAGEAPGFAEWLQQAIAAGVVAPWAVDTTAVDPREPGPLVATPDMPALCRWLLRGQAVQTLCTVDGLRRTPSGWAVTSAEQVVEAGFDAVIIAMPPAQAAALLTPHRGDWAVLSQAQTMSPCWTLMAVTDAPMQAAEAFIRSTSVSAPAGHPITGKFTPPSSSPLAMVIRQDTKPSRVALPGCASWVAHAQEGWTRAHLEASAEVVLPILKTALQEMIGAPVAWHHAAVHRWRYAQFAGTAQTTHCLWDQTLGLGVCGDAWGQGGVAGAYASASSLSNLILNR